MSSILINGISYVEYCKLSSGVFLVDFLQYKCGFPIEYVLVYFSIAAVISIYLGYRTKKLYKFILTFLGFWVFSIILRLFLDILLLNKRSLVYGDIIENLIFNIYQPIYLIVELLRNG